MSVPRGLEEITEEDFDRTVSVNLTRPSGSTVAFYFPESSRIGMRDCCSNTGEGTVIKNKESNPDSSQPPSNYGL
jgi:hypothetical protein